MNTAPKLKPNREYYKVNRKLKRKRIPMRPAVPCMIVDKTGNIAYSPTEKCQVAFGDNMPRNAIVTFPSRTQAKKALWHILQNPHSGMFMPPYEVVRVKLPSNT